MNRYRSLLLVHLVHLVLLVLPVRIAFASSAQAYQDYLYQFDQYRQKYAAFATAKSEYLKFKSLSSQTTALSATTAMLSQRYQLLRAYLLLIGEKLSEDTGLTQTQISAYRSLLNTQIELMKVGDQHVQSIGSLDEAETRSTEFEKQYQPLSSTIRRTIIGVTMGQLISSAKRFDAALSQARTMVERSRSTFTPQKQATMDRWLLQIANVRSLYQQKIDEISAKNDKLTELSLDGMDDAFRTMKRELGDAKRYLADGTGYLGELIETLTYQN